MKTYKIKSSAVRAAKKEMGDAWMDFAEVVQVGEEFAVQLKATINIPAIKKEVAIIDQLAAIQAESDEKAAKKREIESRKPAFIPSTPVTIAVAEIPAPIPQMDSASIPEIAPPADIDVPKMAAAADKQANERLTHVLDSTTCPDCGSEELFLGMGNLKTGIVENEDTCIGCHACGWFVDTRKHITKLKFSTAKLPTKLVWDIADKMPGAKRKEVVEACVAAGIAYGTARTQYQHWFKCVNDQKSAPLAVIGKDGKVTMTNGK